MTSHFLDRADHALEIRRALSDPLALCAALGISKGHKRQPNGVIVCCPWHPDRAPSCSVRVAQDGTIACCCMSCGATGDALSLVAAVRGLDVSRDFRAVLEAAAEIAGVRLDDAAPRAVAPAPRRPAPPPEPEPLYDATFSAIVAPILHLGRLDDSPIAADVTSYLDARGLLAEARADGWAALPRLAETQRAWVRMLVEAVGETAVEASRLRYCGTFVWSDNRLVIPWRDPAGNVQTIQRRTILDGSRGGTKYVFPAGRKPRHPFGVERVRAGVPIAIAEGAADVLALRRIYRETGVDRDVIGIPGVNGWASQWAELCRGRVVYIATDADEPGEKAVGPIAADLYAAGAASVKRAVPTTGKDWTEALAS